MNPAQILQLLQLANIALSVVESAGVNFKKLADLRAKAKAEGREISAEELQQLSADAQSAIDAAKGA